MWKTLDGHTITPSHQHVTDIHDNGALERRCLDEFPGFARFDLEPAAVILDYKDGVNYIVEEMIAEWDFSQSIVIVSQSVWAGIRANMSDSRSPAGTGG